jgi:hypothetical protein
MTVRKIAALLMLLPLMAALGWRAGKELAYRRDCQGHLKRAANANTVDLAREELGHVLAYLERRGMTSGSTAVLYETPGDDVGYWHRNLQDALTELEALPDDASPLEKSNMLLKLRETILEQGGDGESVTSPSGIAVFPDNKAFALLGLLFGALAIGGCVYGLREDRGHYLRLSDLVVAGIGCTAAFLIPMALTL